MHSEYLFDAARHINDLYVINDVRIYEFLKNNLFLLKILEEIPEHIKIYFGERILEIEYYEDCEEDRNFLIIHIIVDELTADDSIDKLTKFDQEYWLSELRDRNIWENLLVDIQHSK